VQREAKEEEEEKKDEEEVVREKKDEEEVVREQIGGEEEEEEKEESYIEPCEEEKEESYIEPCEEEKEKEESYIEPCDEVNFSGAGHLSRSFGNTVSGSETRFEEELRVGDSIEARGEWKRLLSVASNTTAVFDSSFEPPIVTHTAYIIHKAATVATEGGFDGHTPQLTVESLRVQCGMPLVTVNVEGDEPPPASRSRSRPKSRSRSGSREMTPERMRARLLSEQTDTEREGKP